MRLQYYRKNVYGVDLFYLLDKQTVIESLTGRKTVTPKDIACLEALGFELVEVLKPTTTWLVKK